MTGAASLCQPSPMVARTRAQAMKAGSPKTSGARSSASGERRGRAGRRDPSPRGILRRGGASASRTSSSATSRKGKVGAPSAASARGKVGATSAASAQAKVGAASAAFGKAKVGAASAASGSRGPSGPMKSNAGAGSAASARSKAGAESAASAQSQKGAGSAARGHRREAGDAAPRLAGKRDRDGDEAAAPWVDAHAPEPGA